MLDVYVRFFQVHRCGYYQRGSNTASISSIEDTLLKLREWATDGKEFANTTTYQAFPQRDLFNTYFNDSAHCQMSGDHVLVLWNEVPNDNGVIYGKNPLEHPGSTDMLTTGFDDENVIPGLPSYFWFIPEHNAFATIKFQHSYAGKGNLDHYLNGFLRNKSPYRVFSPEDPNEVIGFSVDGVFNENSAKLYANFQAVGMKNEDLVDSLLQNLGRITKMIKKEELSYINPDNREWHERIFGGFFNGLTAETPEFGPQNRLITHELQFRPSEVQLREIVRSFDNSDDISLRNVGFQYNDGTRVMLSGTSISNETRLRVTRSDNESISAQVLLNAILEERATLLAPLNENSATSPTPQPESP
ncbi:hypothetical protein P3517_23965 [Vibrio parahaemolyticus]|nr:MULTISPECIES: hypothetical protein [Vibrio]EIZ1899260.1 hypothetical protein [Vibrio parahaemolyticus]ELA6807499.1 hypothetical protein [Vibrio parahaemolyticus]MCX8936555.1 hypothetical protein [Vibrio parahaemolyticus]MDF4687116.1 hypothetical protein [Vibrio parahaemolyticus]CAE6937223.1 hypothetical protein ACOMICROBIO_LKFPLAJE_03484 [Vibrio sp. B1FIG11]